ncbi:uncharacterized protein LOC131657826 [Vicia villosa]|uniref:uncharacterized protein LOC131657826 n=1 Tax=Vicia villosa TaxID=3911 RepID=UPI00273BD3E8|nr:uncharacterized protein LOC131657826 [Vicia villosa]
MLKSPQFQLSLLHMTRSMLKENRLPNILWREVMVTSAYLLNKCQTKKMKEIFPLEKWTGDKQSVSHLKVFGSVCYKHIPEARRQKLNDRSKVMILVGYHSAGAYKVDPLKDELLKVVQPLTSIMTMKLELFKKELLKAIQFIKVVKHLILFKGHKELDEYPEDSEPVGIEEALKKKLWLNAMKEELEAIERNKTWELIKLPKEKKAIIMFASIARHETIRLVIALAANRNWPLMHIDVKHAFLNGSYSEEVVKFKKILMNVFEMTDLGKLRLKLQNFGMISRFMSKPKWSHYQPAVRIMRYIKGTLKFGVLFPYGRKTDSYLMSYADSYWCGDRIDRRSTS